MKKIFLVFAIAMVAAAAWAIPAKPGVMKLVTRDGSTIDAELVGDEYHHCYKSLDGFIVRQTDDNFYVKTDERYDAAKVSSMRQMAKARQEAPIEPKSIDVTTTNYASKGLVILVSFKDKAFTHTNESFTNMMNQQGYNYNGATGSAKDYFKACSFNKYNPEFDVYGPYTLDRNMSYYGQNDSWGNDAHADQMVVDAVAKMVAAEGQNVLQQYDCDNDGYVDNVFIFYAGYAESAGASDNTIWPHKFYIFSSYVTGQITYGGKTLYDYACSSELAGTYGTTRNGIGAFCHEFSHVLGLPDLYDTNYSYGWATPGEWDIMDGGCYNNDMNTPPVYSAQERFYVGWLTPTVLNQSGNYTLSNVNTGNGQAYMITSTGKSNLRPDNPSPKQYYLLENRQKSGWDAYLPGHGMLVWKINFSASKWENNTVNNNKSSLGCVVVAAGGDQKYGGYYYTSSSDPFPGTSMVRTFNPYSNYALSQISESNGQISFTLGVTASVEEVLKEDGPVIIREKVIGGKVRIERLKEGMTVKVVDATGRILTQKTAEENIMEFDAPEVVYFIRIE